MANLSKMHDCAGRCPLLAPLPSHDNLDIYPHPGPAAPVGINEQWVRTRPWNPIWVPTMCVLCREDNGATPWCKPPLIAVKRCRRCNKPCCHWHIVAHDFYANPPFDRPGCYNNPMDAQFFCSRTPTITSFCRAPQPPGCFERLFRRVGRNSYQPYAPGPRGWMRIPDLAQGPTFYEGYCGIRWFDLHEELFPDFVWPPDISPEARRRGPPPFISVIREHYVNDPDCASPIAMIWADFDHPTYVNGMVDWNGRVFNYSWNGRVFADGSYPTW